MTEKTAYRQILKATSIFGGVQVFQIILQIIKSKVVALLLGPAGFGLMSLLTTTTTLISNGTNFGLGISAVKDVSEANASGNDTKVAETISVLKRLVWYTGMLGTVITGVLAPWISQITFGNDQYTYSFVFLSVTLLITQLSIGQRVVIQGMRQIKLLAKASAVGSLLGLCFSIPLYYYLGLDGIVPAIIISSIFTLSSTWWYSRKVSFPIVNMQLREIITKGKSMLKMGFVLSVSGLFPIISSYALRIFIGDIEEVGLYSAGFAIITTYVGLVFNAMGTDYYPRLSEIATSNEKSKAIVNQQAEISILILGPILLFLIVFINILVVLLYSAKFELISDMIRWSALGMYFRAVGWAIAFLFLARGNSKVFFWNELVFGIYMLVFNMIGYKFWGLTGLGISFLISYIVYFLQVFIITRIKYSMGLTVDSIKIFLANLLFGVGCFLVMMISNEKVSYLFGVCLICLGAYYSFVKLNDRIDIKSLLKNKK